MSKLDELAAKPKPVTGWQLTDEETAKVVAAREHGWSWRDIAKALSDDQGEYIPESRVSALFRGRDG